MLKPVFCKLRRENFAKITCSRKSNGFKHTKSLWHQLPSCLVNLKMASFQLENPVDQASDGMQMLILVSGYAAKADCKIFIFFVVKPWPIAAGLISFQTHAGWSRRKLIGVAFAYRGHRQLIRHYSDSTESTRVQSSKVYKNRSKSGVVWAAPAVPLPMALHHNTDLVNLQETDSKLSNNIW